LATLQTKDWKGVGMETATKLIAKSVEVDVETLRDAISSPVLITRNKARSRIIHTIIDSLDGESTMWLGKYLTQENPCRGEE
jgi:hypothetical protein